MNPILSFIYRPLEKGCGNLARMRFRSSEAARPDGFVPPDFPGQPSEEPPVGKVALVGIAKDEDNYIDEWIDYHLRLGVDHVFLYQNDWRARLKNPGPRVTLIPFDGPCRQCEAFNDFLRNRSEGYDFGLFFDVDEYLCLADGRPLRDFLAPFLPYMGIALNWRLFGDSGRAGVENGDYSVLPRFTRCARDLSPIVKCIVNLRHLPGNLFFDTPHHPKLFTLFRRPFMLARLFVRWDCLVTVDGRHRVFGAHTTDCPDAAAWVNHYAVKTMQEFVENRQRKGGGHSGASFKPIERFHRANFNEVEHTEARDFYESSLREHSDGPLA